MAIIANGKGVVYAATADRPWWDEPVVKRVEADGSGSITYPNGGVVSWDAGWGETAAKHIIRLRNELDRLK